MGQAKSKQSKQLKPVRPPKKKATKGIAKKNRDPGAGVASLPAPTGLTRHFEIETDHQVEEQIETDDPSHQPEKQRHIETDSSSLQLEEQRRIEIDGLSFQLEEQETPLPSAVEVMNVLGDITSRRAWRNIGGKVLLISSHKLDAIEKDYSTDHDRLQSSIKYWLTWDPSASWRKLIDQLYWEHEWRTADSILCHAERTEDPSLNLSNVLAALEDLKAASSETDSVHDLEDCLSIPYDKWREIRKTEKNYNDYRRSLVDYFIRFSPYNTWQMLEIMLHHFEQAATLEKVKPFISSIKDPSLTAARLAQILEKVENRELEWVCYNLGIPSSSYTSLAAQGVQDLADYYITNATSNSWSYVATVLYYFGQYEALEMLDQIHSIKRERDFRPIAGTGKSELASSIDSVPLKISRQERRAKARMAARAKHKVPPLSVAKVMTLLEGLANERSWKYIGGVILLISSYKLDVIERSYFTDKLKLQAAIQYWLLWDPLASWRRLIDRLCRCNASHIMNEIMHYAEKQKDPTFTHQKVSGVLESVTAASSELRSSVLETCLRVPDAKWKELRSKYDNFKYRKSLVDYFIRFSPYCSWQMLESQLLLFDQTAALKKVKPYIKAKKDPTLTVTKLTEILKQVESDQLDSVGYFLGIPVSSYGDIAAQGIDAVVSYYLTNLLSASWRHVAASLYLFQQHEALESLREHVPSIKRSGESSRLFNEAMKLGHVDSQSSKIILYGAAGAGKTSSMDLFIRNEPANKRVSTPLAARPVTMYQIDTSKKKWEKLPFQKKKKVLAQVIGARAKLYEEEHELGDGNDSDMESSISDEGVEEVDADTGTVNATKAQSTRASPTEDAHRLHPVALTADEIAIFDQQRSLTIIRSSHITYDSLVELTVFCDPSDDLLVSSFHRLYLIDSGGQPQFHEILPIFLHHMNLYIFVLKLSEELSIKPMVEYYDSSGKPVGKPYQSYLSNEQLLRHCLRMLRSHRSADKSREKRSKIMIVGTHRDKEGKCRAETRQSKNKKLANILLPEFEDEVIYFEEDFIFPVNAADPQPQDIKLAEEVQKIILADCCADAIKLPLQYYGLEIFLEELSQDRWVLSKQECLEAACELHFNEHTLDNALQFLTEISVVFYFPEILQELIFTNSQVLLDKVTELVEAIHSNRPILTGTWKKFKKYAIFTEEFLSQEEFQKHYVKGVFTVVELIRLFKGLFIIADFGSLGEYIMPALLPHLEEKSLCEYRVSSECPAAALALDFPHGGPCLGIFCSLMCFLLSSENHYPVPWKIKLQRGSTMPVCLTRNCIQFSIPRHPGTVTLIDTFTHFEVHFSIPNSATEACPKLCSFIVQAISIGIRKAAFTLGYSNSEPSLALICPCGEGDASHTASFDESFWICSQDECILGKLEERHLVWHGKGKQSADQGLQEFTIKNIRAVLEELSPRKYLNLALELNLTKRSVEKHEMDWPRDSDRVLTEIIQDWLDSDETASWSTLNNALRKIQPTLAGKF